MDFPNKTTKPKPADVFVPFLSRVDRDRPQSAVIDIIAAIKCPPSKVEQASRDNRECALVCGSRPPLDAHRACMAKDGAGSGRNSGRCWSQQLSRTVERRGTEVHPPANAAHARQLAPFDHRVDGTTRGAQQIGGLVGTSAASARVSIRSSPRDRRRTPRLRS